MIRALSLSAAEFDSDSFFEQRHNPADFRVALVHPFLAEAKSKNRLKFRESLALGYLTASLERAGYDVITINAELEFLTPAGVADRLRQSGRIDLVGISAKSQRTYRAAKEIAGRVKGFSPETHVTIGGVFPSAASRQVLTDSAAIDSVVAGEGEYALTDLAWHLASGTPLTEMLGLAVRLDGEPVVHPARPRIRNLDDVPWPSRRDLEWILAEGQRGGHSAYMVASRGCYASCTFCSIHQIYGDHNVVRRSPQSIVQEMQVIQTRYGISRFSFVDDLFIMPSPKGYRWVDEFCDEVKAAGLEIKFYAEMRADTIKPEFVNKLVEVGLHRLFIGIESGVDSVLTRWDKGTTMHDNDLALKELRAVSLPVHAINFGYITFDADMTLDELEAQYAWIRSSGYCKVQHLQNKMNIYWGTAEYQRMISTGRADPTPLGDRWQYEFTDWRVGAVERTVRWFHLRYEAEVAEPAIRAREAFLEKVQEDLCVVPVPSWLFGLLNQASRRLDGLERSLYYKVFDAVIERVRRGEQPDDAFLENMWRELSAAFSDLVLDSTLLEEFSSSLGDLRVVPAGVELQAGEASCDVETRTAAVRLPSGRLGLLARDFEPQLDRYAHASQIVEY